MGGRGANPTQMFHNNRPGTLLLVVTDPCMPQQRNLAKNVIYEILNEHHFLENEKYQQNSN